jgi:hypothetical protein
LKHLDVLTFLLKDHPFETPNISLQAVSHLFGESSARKSAICAVKGSMYFPIYYFLI